MKMLTRVTNTMNKINPFKIIMHTVIHSRIQGIKIMKVFNSILDNKIIIVINITQCINNINKIQVINKDIHQTSPINKIYLRICLIHISRILKLSTRISQERFQLIKNKD